MDLRRYTPAVERHWLLLTAGVVWTVVGGMLVVFASEWLALVGWRSEAVFGGAGVLAALAVYRFGFSRLAVKNGERIVGLVGRRCLFSFQAWRSYLVVAFMMALGIALRSSPIPKPYLAVLYLAIGGGLFFSSLHYYRRIPALVKAQTSA